MDNQQSGVKEECGVFGIWSSQRMDVSHDIYYGLLALQHRGQEAAGMAVCNTDGVSGNLWMHKDLGLVTEVFNEKTLDEFEGNIGIGHVRYSTTGNNNKENAQPVAGYYQKGTLALVHNGNIVNSDSLRNHLMDEVLVFHATTDTEVIHGLLAQERAKCGSIETAVKRAVPNMVGGYALVIMSPRKIVAVRDPLGLKPLCLGRSEDKWVVASESCALRAVGAKYVRDIEPGEIVTISRSGIQSDTSLCQEKHAHCVFEYIYFARLDSSIDKISVYNARFKGGQMLAKAYPIEADVVAGVPESGITAAAGYAAESGLPFIHAFYKNSYIGRTFIKPTQAEREAAVHMKLNVLKDTVKGKRLVLIDDSIVRGTTIANLIKELRAAGALEVHVRISSPPFLYPCYYGTDVPDNSQLIAKQMDVDSICRMIGADSLGYMRIEDLGGTVEDLPLCMACFNGNYPTDIKK